MTAKKTAMTLPLVMISYDAGTQQRVVCKETLEHYIALMKDGVEFPPLDVVFDGKKYFLWDGFHRLFAAREAGKKTFACEITKGSQRDAVWLSFAANKQHGKPRDRHVAREILEKILGDAEWREKTHDEIAAHIGVSRQRVGEIIRDIKKGGDDSDNARGCDKDNHDSGNPESTAKNNVYSGKKADAAFKTPTEPQKVYDSVGRLVPDSLAPLFRRAGMIETFAARVDELRRDTTDATKQDPNLWFFFNPNNAAADFKNLKRQYTFAVPYAVCPYCGGKDSGDCRACKGMGYLTKDHYAAVPEEMKK
jgi:uncharacterized ParB-like nuclease family protein